VGCDLERFPRQCAITQQKYPRPECKECKKGQENMAKAATPVPRGNETIQPKKEEVKVSNETLRNAILRVLGRKGEMNISILKNFAGQEASKEEFQKTIDELSISGRIVKKAGIREGSFKVCLPGNSGSPTSNAVRKPEPSKADGDSRPAASRKPKEKAINPVAGDGVFAAAIAELEAKRQNIDNAIAALKALG
jgi:hypothetical protein